jgi:hypothetical protein
VILTIDNLDGAGAIDYSTALTPDGPLKISRTLNAPSRCTAMLDLAATTPPLPMPVRRGRVVVSSTAGTILFTGYLATEPASVYAGAGTAGPVYRVVFTAISDEWLLDRQTIPLTGAGFAQFGGELLTGFAARVAPGLLTTAGVANGSRVGVFTPEQTQPWSATAGEIAGATYAAYRALDGALIMQPAGTVTHTLDFDSPGGGGSLQVAELKTAKIKELANDVTVSGEIEPDAYVTEVFAGDGTTSVFALTEAPFRATPSKLVDDSFNQSVLDRQIWSLADPGSHLALTSAGLTFSGGNGFDGQTTLTAIDAIELAGSLVVEAGSVQLTAGSDGVLCGLYGGLVQRSNCFAGYNVRQSGGATVVTPMVNGAETGTTYTVLTGHAYTLRIRLHSAEMQRVLQTYYARVDGVIQSFGGGYVTAPVALVFELQDLGVASNTPATVLYDGSVASSPASCALAAVDSIQLFGSMGYCRATQTGSAWVVSALPGGALQTRLLGVAGEGVDCSLSAAGRLTFFAGRIPVAGETVSVLYRTRQRAVARLEDLASVATEALGAAPGTARWLGKVLKPAARCSADCESAAQAVLALASSRAAAIAGRYAAINPPEDVWPRRCARNHLRGQHAQRRRPHRDHRGWQRRAGDADLHDGICQRLGGEPGHHALRSHRRGRATARYRADRYRRRAGEPAADVSRQRQRHGTAARRRACATR